MTTIHITANGDVEGIDCTLDMDVYHEILKQNLSATYPGAEITIRGDRRTDGGNSAWMTDDEGDEHDISHIVESIYVIACSDPRWEPNVDAE